jgi:Icc-related predicted phosphoesterase
MNIQLLSDLHLESNPTFMPRAATGADVLVLAGDIGSYQTGSALASSGDADFGLARFSPRHGWPTPVLFVPGNHEYDGLDFDEAHARLKETCAKLGITWLEREVVQLGGVRFVGTTLWTDFDALGPLAGQPIPDPLSDKIPAHFSHPNSQFTRQLKARDKAFRAANFYLCKAKTTRRGEAWLAQGLREQALQCQDWLRQALNTPFDGSTVVVTHFAPSLHSADPRYGLVPGTAGFCNALDALLPQAQLWLHGHLHCPSDYTVNGCRVVANPLGYAHKHEQRSFKPTALISL